MGNSTLVTTMMKNTLKPYLPEKKTSASLKPKLHKAHDLMAACMTMNSESCIQAEHKMPLYARSVLIALNWLINF